MTLLLPIFPLLLTSAAHALLRGPGATKNFGDVANVSQDLLSKCQVHYFETYLDHFSRSKGPDEQETFQLRYFVCGEAHRAATENSPPGPIFFYLGNEANVLLYLNATGLMWENAAEFGAMLIFAEHRYYGESLPFGDKTFEHMEWLSSEQALADYATLLRVFKKDRGLENAPVIGFGGSYGGMLATWARLKYPHVWQGAVAGSAPIWAYVGQDPPMDPDFYAKGVTYDTSVASGAAPGCTDTLRNAWSIMIEKAEEGERGLDYVTSNMNICDNVKLNTTDDAYVLRDWAGAAFDMMAMGNYPFPSGYMLNGHGELPAFPMRVACSALMDVVEGESTMQGAASRRLLADQDIPEAQRTIADDSEKVLQGLSSAVSVWYNYTGELECFNPWQGVNDQTSHIQDLWDYQWCTEQFMPNARNGVSDMFWSSPWNQSAAIEGCQQEWGVTPRPYWAVTEWGGRSLSTLSNVVFSNGLFDPWHGGGVLEDLSDSVKAVIIPDGAHHLDLMFSNPEDPDTVKAARAIELDNIRRWVEEYHSVPLK